MNVIPKGEGREGVGTFWGVPLGLQILAPFPESLHRILEEIKRTLLETTKPISSVGMRRTLRVALAVVC